MLMRRRQDRLITFTDPENVALTVIIKL